MLSRLFVAAFGPDVTPLDVLCTLGILSLGVILVGICMFLFGVASIDYLE